MTGLSSEGKEAAMSLAAERRARAIEVDNAHLDYWVNWIFERTAIQPVYTEREVLASVEFRGSRQIVIERSYPQFLLDDLLVAFNPHDPGLHLVGSSETGKWLGPRVSVTHRPGSVTEETKHDVLVKGLALAMTQMPALHPADEMREEQGVCPYLREGVVTAQREAVVFHRCLCLIVHPGGSEDWCRADGLPPDAPFCTGCEDRHPELDHERSQVMAVLP